MHYSNYDNVSIKQIDLRRTQWGYKVSKLIFNKLKLNIVPNPFIFICEFLFYTLNNIYS